MRLIYGLPLFVLLAACAAGAPQQDTATDDRPPATPPTATVLAPPTAGETASPPTAPPAASPAATATALAPPTAAPPSPSLTAPAPVVAAACQNRYYPIAQGAAWTYRLSGTVNDTFTRAIIGVRADGFDDQDTFTSGAIRRGSWTCRQGAVISLTPSGASVIAGSIQTDFTVESNEGLTFPADPQAGATWAQKIVYLGQFNASDRNITARSTLNMSCQAVGMESVSVPAGTFEALRADCTYRIDIALLGDVSFNSSASANSSAWYAPGVGLVKRRDTGEMGTSEVVLLSSTLP